MTECNNGDLEIEGVIAYHDRVDDVYVFPEFNQDNEVTDIKAH